MPTKSTRKRKRGRSRSARLAESPKAENDSFQVEGRSNSVADPPESPVELTLEEPEDESMQLPSGQSSPVNSQRKMPQKALGEVSNEASLPATSKDPVRVELTTPVVFQCSSCRTIFADTLEGYLGSNAETGTVSFKAARRICVADEDEISSTGWLRRCVFQKLSCEECGQVVGCKLNSTTTEFDSLRGAYTFDKSCLLTYQLGSCAPVPQDPARVTAEKTASDANIAVLRAMEEQICLVSEAVQGLAEGLEAKHIENAKVHDAFLLWDERFQRLENLETRLRQYLNNHASTPIHGISTPTPTRSTRVENTTLSPLPVEVASGVEKSPGNTVTENHGSILTNEEPGERNQAETLTERPSRALGHASGTKIPERRSEMEPMVPESFAHKDAAPMVRDSTRNIEAGFEGRTQPPRSSKFPKYNGMPAKKRLPA